MPSIADVYVTVLPETAQIAAGIEREFRKVDTMARDAGKRWSREIENRDAHRAHQRLRKSGQNVTAHGDG